MNSLLSVDELKPRTWGGFWDIFGRILVDLLDIQEGQRVLDIGTGGGSVLYPLSEKVGKPGQVIGVETCEHCAKRTSAEIKRCKIGNSVVHFMDAREANFEEHSFDCVTAGFIGWNDYFDFKTLKYKKPDELMQSICRLLKPGGKLGISTWLLQEDLDWMYEFLSANSIESKRNYSTENEKGWKKILSEAGFQDIRVYTRIASFTYDTLDFWWKEMMDYEWPVKGKNSDVITDAIKADAFKSIQEHQTETGGIPFKRNALFATAAYSGVGPSFS
ncbi:MAG: class I SAM-dependent methyltransferase [Promethearchaeota archaeon]